MNKKIINWWNGGVSYDPDYQAWLTQIIADGGTEPTPTVKAAQNNYVLALKAISSGDIWTYLKSLYFLHCGDLTTGRRNVKNPATYRTTLSGTNTFSEGNGTRSDGTSYINQPMQISDWANAEINFSVMQYVSQSSVTTGEISHGFATSATRYLFLRPLAVGAITGDLWNASLAPYSFTNANNKGRYITTYQLGTTETVIFINGSRNAAVLISPAGTSSFFINRFILAANDNGPAVGHFQKYLALDAVISREVSDAEAALLDTAMSNYITAAGLA